jgi:hypothetical protein
MPRGWALSSTMFAIILGETSASGASSRMCRSTLPSRFAISANDPTWPSVRSVIQARALAIAVSSASRSVWLAASLEGE